MIDSATAKCFDGVIYVTQGGLVTTMSFEEALSLASRDEGFKASVYAMNTLLIHKGIYTQEEFQTLFAEWVEKEQRRKAPEVRRAESSRVFSA